MLNMCSRVEIILDLTCFLCRGTGREYSVCLLRHNKRKHEPTLRGFISHYHILVWLEAPPRRKSNTSFCSWMENQNTENRPTCFCSCWQMGGLAAACLQQQQQKKQRLPSVCWGYLALHCSRRHPHPTSSGTGEYVVGGCISRGNLWRR